MASRGFQFKQFFVAHDKCAMKVGTDGTLLGAMASMQSAKCKVLDVGTGSGLVALMLAQRFKEAEIDAIDIDEGAVEQAEENFSASPWGERLHAHRSSLQAWKKDDDDDDENVDVDEDDDEDEEYLYDLIVSNPPYFQNSLKNPDKGREMARHTDTLSYEELVVHSRRLLREDGCLWLILPAEAEEEMLRLAARHDLRAEKVVYIHSKPGKPTKRVILCLAVDPRTTHGRPTGDPRKEYEVDGTEKKTFYIESAYSPRSEEYAELTRDFYL